MDHKKVVVEKLWSIRLSVLILWKTKLSKSSQEERENWTNSVSIKEIEFIFKNLPTKKSLDLEGSTGKSHQAIK